MTLPKRLKESLVLSGILLALLIVFFYDVFFLGKTFKATTANSQALPNGVYGQADNKPPFIPVNGTDSSVLEEPILEFVKQSLQQGILPLWNPHQACGFPLIGMMEIGLFYPLNAILYLFPNIISWDLLILSRFFVGGFLTYWLMRTLRFSRIPSLGAAIVFMFSGPMVLLQYWTANVDILAPLLLLCMERLIRAPKIKNMIFLALTEGLIFFAGHPEHIFLVNVYAFLFFLFRCFSLRKKIAGKKALGFLFGGYALGIAISSVVLLPFLFNVIAEFWHGHPPGTGLTSGEDRDRILSLIVPHFFQKEPLTYQFTFAGWWGGYLGILPLVVGAVGLFNRQRNGLNYFFAALLFLVISKAYGFGYINWIGWLPIFNICRYAIHTPHLAALTIAILTGMGLRTILLQKHVLWKATIPCVVALSLIGYKLYDIRISINLDIALKAGLFAFSILAAFWVLIFLKEKKLLTKKIFAAAIVCLISLELFSYIHRQRVHRFDSFAPVPYIDVLKNAPEKSRAYGVFWAFYPNTATGFQTDDLGVFFSLLSKRFVHFINALVIPNHFKVDLRPPALRMMPLDKSKPFLDLLNVKYTVTPSDETMTTMLNNFARMKAEDPPVYSGEANLFFRKTAFSRAFIVHGAIFEPNEERSLEILKKLQNILDKVAVVNREADPQMVKTLAKSSAAGKSETRILAYTPNRVQIETSLDHPGLLVLSDTYHPDWQVFVDGKREELLRTDYLLRSVFLTKGKHDVLFVFRPVSFYLGAFLTVLSLLAAIFLWNLPKLSRKFE